MITKYEQITNRIDSLREASYRCYHKGLADMGDMFKGFMDALIYERSAMTVFDAMRVVK